MEDLFSRIINDLVARVSGPVKFRLILQPAMAAFFAIRSGLKDAKENKPPYFWAIFTNPESRREMIRDGWKSVGNVFILAIIPYLLIRGPVNRIAQRK